jgi:hypothetical protein
MKKVLSGLILAVSLYGENFIVNGSKAWEQFDNGKKILILWILVII